MRFSAHIKHGHITMASKHAKEVLLGLDVDVIIEVDDKPSTRMRRFFEGAVVPSAFYQLPNSGWETFRDAREALKLEFLPIYTTSIKGGKVRSAKSTADLTKAEFNDFLEHITAWMLEQGMEVPDSKDYKAWENSAPETGAIYPPLQRLKDAYIIAKA